MISIRKHGVGNHRNDLTAEYVRAVLDYDPETGVLRWRQRPDQRPEWNTRYAGTVAGTFDKDGYRKIRIDRRPYYAHRLVWLVVTGTWPIAEIDHRNLDPSDNRLANLREATRGENMRNTRVRADNTSGVKGVSWDEGTGKQRVQVRDESGRQIHIGLFVLKEDAKAAVIEARARLHGKFARAA